MNPMVGLQAPPAAQQGLMGNVMQPPSLMNSAPGNWSQVAYQMAGSPKQGGLYPTVAAPPTLPGTTGTSSGTGSALGGTALGIISALAKNPALMKSAGNGISSLWNGIAGGGSAAAGLGGATAYGTDAAVAPASALTSELPATATGTYSAAPAATGGLMGAAATPAASAIPLAAGAGTLGATGASLGAGAPGVFASGSAAAGSGGAAAGGATLGAAGTAAAVAAPFLFQQAGLALGDAWSDSKGQQQAMDAMKAWAQATGATNRIVNPPTAQQAAAVSGGGLASVGSGYQPHVVTYDANGKPMSNAAAQLAVLQWAQAKGIPTGALISQAQAQHIIDSGGYGSQVYSGPTPTNNGSWAGLLADSYKNKPRAAFGG